MKFPAVEMKLTTSNGAWPHIPLIVLIIVVLIAIFSLDLGWAPLVPGAIALLLFFWLSMRHPDKAFIILMGASILLPIDFAIKVADWPRIGPTRVLLAVFLIGFMTRQLLSRDEDYSWKRWPLKIPIALFLLLATISSVQSINPVKSYYSLISYAFEQFLLFFVIAALLRKTGFFRSAKNWLYIFTVVVCVYSFLEEIFRINPIMLIYPEEALLFRGEILRVRASFFHPIAFGCFLTLVFPFVLIDVLSEKKGGRRRFLVCLLAAILASLMLTVSRGPWIGLLIGVVLLTFIWKEKRKYAKGIALCIAAVAIISAAWIYLDNDAMRRSVDSFINPSALRIGQMDEGSSEYYRIALAKAIFNKMNGYRWFFGFGPGTFFIADVDSRYAGHEHTLTAADSHYLKLFFEHGVLGLVAFIILLGFILKDGLKRARITDHRFNRHAGAAFCAVGCFIFENLTVSMFILFPLSLIFWLSVGLIYVNQVRPFFSTSHFRRY